MWRSLLYRGRLLGEVQRCQRLGKKAVPSLVIFRISIAGLPGVRVSSKRVEEIGPLVWLRRQLGKELQELVTAARRACSVGSSGGDHYVE